MIEWCGRLDCISIFFKSGEVIISFGLRTTFFRYQLWLPRMTKSGKLRKRQLYHFLTSVHLLCFCFLLMFNTFFRYACTGVLVATATLNLTQVLLLLTPSPNPLPHPPKRQKVYEAGRKQLTFAEIQKYRNSKMKMLHYPDLGSASDWLCNQNWLKQSSHVARPSANKFWVLWHFIRMEFLWLFLRCSFPGKTVVVLQNVGCFLRLRTRFQTVILLVTPVLTALIFLSSSSISLSTFFSSSTVYSLSWCTWPEQWTAVNYFI